MSDLPKGWVETELESIVSFCIGGDWGKDLEFDDENFDSVKVIRGTDYKNWSRFRAKNATQRKIKTTSLATRQLKLGDIVVEISGGGPTQPVGRTILIDDKTLGSSDLPLVCSNFFRLLRVSESVDSALINYCLINHYNNGKFDDFQTQTTNLRNLNFTQFLTKTTIPLPPLNEQKRIVAKLEALLSRVDAGRERLEKIPKILKRFRQSVLAAACSGKLTADWRAENTELESSSELFEKISEERKRKFEEDCRLAVLEGRRKPKNQDSNKKSRNTVKELPEIPDFWNYFRLEELSYLVTDGTHHTPTYLQEGTPFLSVKNVRPFLIKDKDIKFVSKEQHKEINQRCNPEKGDILYTKVGATYGYAAVNNLDYDFSIFVSLALIKPVIPFFNSKYAELVMNSEVVFSQARERISGIGTPDLHLVEIRDFRIPLPPLPEQKEIVRRVEDLFKFADSIEERFKQAKAQVDKLTNSILAKAFRGELVPQDERDEPASVLLERIKAEKVNGNAKQRKLF
jgi:type I restriction enzyme S subunit